MRVLIFGASGVTGRLVVAAALARGHAVTGFVRNAEKLAIADRRLTVVVGNVADPEAVGHAVADHDAVVSCLGVGVTFEPDPAVVAGIGHIVAAMQQYGVSRLIYLSFLGVGATRRYLGPLLGGVVVPLLLRHEVADHAAKERLIIASELDWTIVRPPKLTNGGATGHYRHGEEVRPVPLFPTLARADLAVFILSQLDDRDYVRKIARIVR